MEWMLMPLKRYAEFSGRSQRQEYWMFYLFQIIVMIVGYVIILAFLSIGWASADPTLRSVMGVIAIAFMVVLGVFSLAIFIPQIAVTVRRLHDTNRSGWWILAPLIPYILAIIGILAEIPAIALIAMLAVLGLGITVFVFLVLDGTPGPNRFGADPKGRGQTDVFK